MSTLLKRINSGETLLSDGAMGTMLFSAGIKSGDCLEAINLSNPQLLITIAKAYFEAGSDIVQTNTFGASPLKLAYYGLEESMSEINSSAVQAVREAVGSDAFVSGSCGPSGRLLKPFGDVDSEEIYQSFKDQISVLINSGVDMVCIETMTDINEAMLALKAAKEVSSDIPVAVTMTFDKTPRGYFTIMGIDIKLAVEELTAAGADIIGSNCGNGISNMVEIATEIVDLSEKPILIQSNAGLPKTVNDQISYSETAEDFSQGAKILMDLKVSIIGGCCGTTPDYIKSVRKLIC